MEQYQWQLAPVQAAVPLIIIIIVVVVKLVEIKTWEVH
jgi:hypothetical protein